MYVTGLTNATAMIEWNEYFIRENNLFYNSCYGHVNNWWIQ